MKYRDHDISRGQSRTKTILFHNFFINDIGYYEISIQFWRYIIIANHDEEKVYTIYAKRNNYLKFPTRLLKKSVYKRKENVFVKIYYMSENIMTIASNKKENISLFILIISFFFHFHHFINLFIIICVINFSHF